MSEFNRRRFLGLAAGAAAAPLLIAPSIAQGRAKVVIIGGGAGGASVAGQLARQAPQLDVTLVEAKPIYTSCFFSNHYLADLRPFKSLQHSYDGLRRLGVSVVISAAADIDTAARRVTLAGGRRLSYDRLVLSPGIDMQYDAIEGYSPVVAAGAMPHAWQAGPQTRLLKRKLKAMRDGGTVVIAVPGNPYRCPPGPYERACVIAHYLKMAKPKSKLIILDAKQTFSKQAVFEEAFRKYYKDIIELNLTNEIDDYTTTKVDPATGTITVRSGHTFVADVANIIPPQRAGMVATRAGCTEGDWCPVNVQNFSSRSVKDVYCLGDATIASDMPKSAFSANSQAKVVAADIIADLASGARLEPRYQNTCWSILAPNDSVRIGGSYAPGEKGGKPYLAVSEPFVSQPSEAMAVRKQNFLDSIAWYASLTADIFANSDAAERHG